MRKDVFELIEIKHICYIQVEFNSEVVLSRDVFATTVERSRDDVLTKTDWWIL